MHRLLSRSWLLKHLFALLILLMMIRLGFWQLSRLEEKRTRNTATLAALAQPATILTTDGVIDPAALHFQKVRVTGSFDNGASVVLRNQTLNGEEGVHLLTPLRITGSDAAVIIDRGWLPPDQNRPSALAAYALPGEVTIEGIAFRSQERPDALLAPMDLPLPGETRINAWMRVDLAKMQQQMDYPLLPVYVVQTPDPTAPPDRLPRAQGLTALDEGPHLSYAIQWFSFALILVFIYTILIRQELRRPASRVMPEPSGAGQSSLP